MKSNLWGEMFPKEINVRLYIFLYHYGADAEGSILNTVYTPRG